MRYHIDTIPVWDALKLDSECPLCALRRQIERGEVDRFLGGSVMEPETRVRVNAKGFCQRHHVLLYAQQNRLGHALMTHTHLRETRQAADKILEAAELGAQGRDASFMKRAMGRGGQDALTAAADALDALTGTCILCDSIAANMNRYAYTLLHLFTHDSAFREAFENSKGVCLKDASLLLRMAAETLRGREQAEFAAALHRVCSGGLRRVEDELEWFTLKFDYRNANKPWNNSRDALDRAITKLRSWCLGAEPDGKK
ncbi:MAG: hypothetical protein IJ214_06060 [Clostridia bacterium]|nr:hypothetical protein [Clostridia bacterium]